MSKEINSVDFISDVLSEKQKMVLFFSDENKSQDIENIKLVLNKFKEKVQNFDYFLYNTNLEKNSVLAENIGANNTPMLMMFKNGNANRWLENSNKVKINAKSILKFIGSPALYQKNTPEEAKEILSNIVSELKETKKTKKIKI